MTTFTDVLTRQLRSDPGRPLVTFYDEATGERVELSVTTYANWVAKTASLLVEEHDLERGDRLRIDLPPHWLALVFLGAAWTAGLVVTGDDDPDAVVCGPATLDAWAGRAGQLPVLACALLPLGVRFAEPLPADVHDVGVEVWSQPDSFIPWDPPSGNDIAHELTGDTVTQDALWNAAGDRRLGGNARILSNENPVTPPGIASFTEPLAKGGSLVLVVGAGKERLVAIGEAERTTARFDA